MKKNSILITCMLAITLSACNSKTGEKSEMENTTNPLLAPSTLPFQAPDFSKITDSDFEPAFAAGIKDQLDKIDQIANNSEAPTFDNTLVALEKSGEVLSRVNLVFQMLAGANTNSVLQALQETIAPKLAAQNDAILLNEKLFEKVNTLYEQKDQMGLDAESARLLDFYLDAFVRAGANLPEEEKTKLKKLNEEEALLGARFTNQVLAAAKDGGILLDDASQLQGLSDSELKGLAMDAEAAGHAGKYLINLQNTTQQPILQSLENRDLRQKVMEASLNRAERGDKNDTREIAKRLAEIRVEKANLLGFPNFAAWNLQDQMAKTPEAVQTFLDQLVAPSVANAKKEAADLQALVNKQKGDFDVESWDWNFYSEQVRKARYDIDENEVKPYFELFNVLENGVFYAATKLYGITFKRRTDIPVYQEDVRVYELLEEDGSELGLFYCDYFQRGNKSGGAWMSNVVEQSRLMGTKPVIYNVCNYTKPAPGEPALISYDDVTTMFHEFGHALHGFFANQTYIALSGTRVARDFVEFPSQFNEHWALYPDVFAHYAVHYKTGEPMPQELVEKIKKSATFNQGYALTEILAAARLDMEWHTITSANQISSVDEFEKAALIKTKLDMKQVPPRYRSSYFLHIWGNGYAAGYYAYLWAEMLDDDAYEWFEENGGLTRENGQRYREMILSMGNTEDYNKMFLDFRGKAPSIESMLKNRGLK